jgi:DNA-binding response OmpR family regulator
VQNILIIDDDPSGTQLMITLLGLYGYRASKLENWKDPLGDVERHRPSMVIMDIHLRSRNGLELLRQLRTHSDPDLAQTPVLMISADDYRKECKQAGASAFLMKPFGYQDLMDAIRSVGEESLLHS